MSDIHGYIEELKSNMEKIDLQGDNRIIFLGDYIDCGKASCQVLQYIRKLQEQFGDEKVIALKGNHEQMFLEWVNDFGHLYADGSEGFPAFNDWLRTDLEYGANTIRTFLSEEQMSFLDRISRTGSWETVNREAASMVLSNHDDLVRWIQNMPSYYETDSQIFVHAGIDEEAEEYWRWGTSDDIFLWKFPASKGKFCKTIIAGHVSTGVLANDDQFHDVFYDGESHYYIDGSVYKEDGKLLLLVYDEDKDKYYQIEENKRMRVKKVEEFQ